MATLKDLFKSQNKELYGLTGKAIIESRGLINPPRAAALLTSSPDAVADLIGNQIGGALGGSANRPSDTIFKNNTPFSKPISLFKTQRQLQTAVDKDTPYFIKQSPAPASLIASFNQGGSTLGGMAANLAIKGITKGGLKDLANSLKKKDVTENYGVRLGKDSNNKVIKENKKFSDFYKNKDGQLEKRGTTIGANGFNWQTASDTLRLKETITDTDIELAEKNGHVIVTFARIIADGGITDSKIPFMGTVSGLSEEVTPEWTNFRYIGSPFKVNRYLGVERSVRFNLKLYYTTSKEKEVMIKKINYLKSLAFPDTNVVTSKFGDNNQYAIAPNIIKFSIGSMYKDVAGYIESLSFEIDDNTTWPKQGKDSNYMFGSGIFRSGQRAFKSDYDKDNQADNFMYPSVIDVSIGIKIIETHKIEGSTTKTYKYNFDGLNDTEKYTIK